jgi:hypothetical protein
MRQKIRSLELVSASGTTDNSSERKEPLNRGLALFKRPLLSSVGLRRDRESPLKRRRR